MKTKRVLCLILTLCMLLSMLPAIGASAADDVIGLKDAFQGYFKIGTALSGGEFSKAEVQALTLKHFNSVTCENEMKPDSTLDQAACQSVGNNVNTQVKLSTDARRILAFCEENHIPMRGHVIAWHSQTPAWFFREGFNNNGAYVTPEIMNQRLESFIKNLFELIAHDYPDLEIYAWDMCNEAFTDSNPANMRSTNESNWIRVYGDNTFIYKAFEYGQKYKPEGCMLCYNDYNEYDDGKLAAISALCKDLYEKGLLDAIGMQSHLTVGNPTIEKYRRALDTYASIGCPIMITELDVQARNGNTAEQIEYYTELFETYGDYKDSIEAVVFWGTQDSASWRPNGNPLLFANGYQPKDVFYAVVDTAADHEHVWRDEVTPPTCTEKGYTTRICTVEGCGRTTTGSYVDALGHKWDAGKVTKPATTTEKGITTFTCTVCGETKTKSIQRVGAKVPDSIDFTSADCLDDIEIVNKTSAAVKDGQGLYLVSTAEAFEPANGQLNGDAATNPKDLVLVPAEGDWVATMKFAFNQGGSQGYYEFFGFYAYDDANNCVGIRGGDGAMQDFLRKDGTVTAETKNYSSGLKSGSLFWYRIEKEADNYTCSISTNGETFTEMFKFENTGIEGETIAIDAYSGMATGYNYTIESLVFEEGDGPVQPVCEHEYEAAVTAPTCTAEGYTTYTCSKCGESYVADKVAALGHDFKKGVCTRCGEADPDYVAPTGYVLADKIEAGEKYVIVSNGYALNSESVADSAIADGYTLGSTPVTIADGVITSEVAENMVWSFETGSSPDAPDYEGFYIYADDGKMLYRSRLGGMSAAALITSEMPAEASINRVFWVVKDLDNAGSKSLVQIGQVTNDADYVFFMQGSGASFSAPWSERASWEGAYANYPVKLYKLTGDAPPICVHDYKATVTEPTCTAKGKTVYTCSKCGKTYEEEIAALGHDFKAGEKVAPTCTEKGYTVYKCSRCDAAENRDEVAALGHKYEEGKCIACGAADPDYKVCPSAKYEDAPAKGIWAHEGIDFCIAEGYMNGMNETTFKPQGTVTRGQLVTIIYRVAESPEVEFKGIFEDVKEGKFYSKAVEWAAAEGVVTGKTATKFAPEEAITREQIAAILYRYKGSPEIEADLSDFPDADDASNYAKKALTWAVKEGLINGIKTDGVNYLSPKTNATRAQIATIIMRFLEGEYKCGK